MKKGNDIQLYTDTQITSQTNAPQVFPTLSLTQVFQLTIADAGISTDFPASLHVNISNNAVCFRDAGFLPVFAASLHYVLTFVTFGGRNITQWSVNSMLKSVFSDLCVDYATENDTVVLRFPVKPGMAGRQA